MEGDKENRQSGITSLRRQHRATMTSLVPSNNENETTRQSRSSIAAPTNTTDRSSVLTPSFQHNAKRGSLPKPLNTPKSLLKTELAFIDAEVSFFISPLAFVDYTYSRQNVIVIQSLFRRNEARTLAAKRIQSVQCMQRGTRCWIAVRYVRP
jgi:hypothetical protein